MIHLKSLMTSRSREDGPTSDDRSSSRRYFRLGGALLIILGIVANHWAIGRLLSGDGSIGWVGYKIPVWVFQSLMLTAGVFVYRRDPLKIGSDLANLALVIGSVVFSLAVCEGYLRVFVAGPVFDANLPFYPHRRLIFHPNLPGVSDTVTVTTNQWGLRGDPIGSDWEALTTILTVGGSTTKGSFLPDDKTWPAQLQQHLRNMSPDISVQNAGLSGHTTRGHLLLFERVALRIKPDMAIFLVGVNDLQLSLDKVAVDQGERSPGWHYTVFASSRALQFFYSWYRVLVNKVPSEEFVQQNPDELEDVLELQPLTRETPLPDDLTAVLPSLGLFERNVRALIAMASAGNIKTLFLTQPLLYGDGEKWAEIQGKSFWFSEQELSVSAATYWRMLEMFNRKLMEICRQENVPCFDLAAAIPHHQDYFYDSMHFTEKGAEFVAQTVFQYMSEQGLIPTNRH
jgi:lysophospholipase L1-like esterase